MNGVHRIKHPQNEDYDIYIPKSISLNQFIYSFHLYWKLNERFFPLILPISVEQEISEIQ